MFGYSYKKPVKAEAAATTVLVGGAVLVGLGLTALGIGCSHILPTEGYNRACQNIWDGACKGVQTGAMKITEVATSVHYHLSTDFLKACLTGWRGIYPDGGQITGYASSAQIATLCGWDIADFGKNGSFGIGVYNLLNPTLLSKYTVAEGVLISCGSVIYKLTNVVTAGFSKPQIGTITRIDSDTSFDVFALGNQPIVNAIGSCTEIAELQSQVTIDGATQYAYWLICNNSAGTGICAMPKTGTVTTPSVPDVYNPADKNIFAEGYSTLNHRIDDVIGRIGALQGIQDGINVNVGDVVGSLDKINDTIRSKTQTQVIDTDATDTATEAENDKTNTGRDTTLPKNPSMPDLMLPTGLQKKFPFCLPWDLAACYKLFQVEPKAPVWSIPVNIDVGMVHVHQTYTYDLNSNGVMDGFLPVFKWFLNLGVVLGLILITRKIMS